MATRPASKLNLQELGIQDEIELVDKQGRTDLASLTQRVDDITPPDNIDISEDGVKVYANYDVNELGWGCEDKTYYFDTAAEFSLGDRTYTKTNAKPAFGGVIGTPGDGQNHAIVMVSTEEDATYYSWNSTAYSFDYNGTTWYYCGGNYSYWGSPATGISIIPDETLSLEDAARYMLDSAQVYVDDGKFSEITEPNSGYLFAGGGSQDDYSDATFKVSKEGVITAQDVEINGESITDKIDNIIDDTTTSDDSTYSSSKIETELSSIEDEVDAIINDTTTASTSTWSSEKIDGEIEDVVSTKTITGNPVEFDDGSDSPLVKCVTTITGSQDLHGYSKPWVGGDGKNKLNLDIAAIKARNTSGTWTGNTWVYNGRTFKLNTLDGVSVYSFDISGAPSSGYPALYTGDFSLPVGEYIISFSKRIRLYKNNTQVLDVTSPATFTVDNASDVYYISIFPGGSEITYTEQPMIRLASVTDPTFEPYSNICPITAYTENTISVDGKNLFGFNKTFIDKTAEYRASSSQRLNIVGNSDNSITCSYNNGTWSFGYLEFTGIDGTQDYAISFKVKDNNTSFTPSIGIGTESDSTKLVIVVNGGNGTTSATTSEHFTLYDLQVERGTAETDYVPFVAHTTHTTTFPSAIYRGSEDVVNGKLYPDDTDGLWYAKDLSDLTWSYDSSVNSMTTVISDIEHPATESTPPNMILSMCPAILANDRTTTTGIRAYIFSLPNPEPRLFIRDTGYTDPVAFKTAMTGQTIAYKVDNPTISSVTPTNLPIKSLLGYNHIESTTGDLEVQYITQSYQPIIDLIGEAVELPKVTSADNGKILQVSDGDWSAETPEFTTIDDTTTSSTETWSSNKISSEVQNIIDDTTSSEDSTWSSNKITEEIEDKTSVTKTATGNPVELSDSADAPLVKCVTAITGSQDLHGYNRPWVGGAGKNKLSKGVSGTSGTIEYTVNDDGSVLVTGTENSSTAFWGVQFSIPAGSYILSGCPTGGGNSSYLIDIRNAVGGGGIPGIAGDIGSGSSFTLSEPLTAYVNIRIASGYSIPSGGLLFKPMIRLSTETDPTFEPYSNICPITAYGENTISVASRNLCNQADKTTSSAGYVIGTNAPDYINTDHTVFPAGTYTFSFNVSGASSGSQAQVIFYKDDTTPVGNKVQSVTTDGRKIFTITANKPFAKIQMYYNGSSGGQFSKFQLERGEESHDYEPYINEQHTTTTYPTSVYRGSEDVVNGTESHDMECIDLGDLVWDRQEISGYGYRYYATLPELPLQADTAHLTSICSHYELVVTGGTGGGAHGYAIVTNGTILFYDSQRNNLTAEEWTTYVTGIQVAYTLATPTTSSVTPTNLPIRTLSGYSHIESSTGDLDIEYITADYQPIVELIEDNAVSDMTGATSITDGTHGLVPAPEAGDEDKFLKGDGTWGESGGNVVYSSTPKIVGKWIDGVTDVYEVTMVTNHINPTGTDYSYFPDTFSKIISVTGSISGEIARSSRYYAPMGGWFKQSNDNINIDCSVYFGNFGPDNVRVYYAFHDQSTITPGGMSCDEQTIVVRYLR